MENSTRNERFPLICDYYYQLCFGSNVLIKDLKGVLLFWLVYFFSIVVIPAIGLFLDKEPSAWERGNIVDYSLSKRSGLIFKSSIRNHTSKFQYPSLRERLYIDKIPKWSSLVVGETVLVEVQSNEFQLGKIVSLTARSDNRGGKVTVKTQENTREFDHNAIRIQGRCITT